MTKMDLLVSFLFSMLFTKDKPYEHLSFTLLLPRGSELIPNKQAMEAKAA